MCLVSSARSPERPVCYAPWRPQKWWTLHQKGGDRNNWTLSDTPQVPRATGYRSMLASCARVTGFPPSHSLVLSSDTEPAPAVPMSLGNNLEMKWHPQHGRIPRITWKAEKGQRPHGWAEPKKRPCMLSLLPAGTTHRGWQDAYGKTYTFFCSLSGLPAASSTCRNSRLLLKL